MKFFTIALLVAASWALVILAGIAIAQASSVAVAFIFGGG